MNFLSPSLNNILDLERVDEIITKTLNTFDSIFPICYQNALLESIMNRGKVTPDTQYILMSSPLLNKPLKSGYLIKQGFLMKSWKQRYFIAYNEADNFIISYSKKENDNEIYRFSCSGYNVESFTKEETELYGENGIKLIPLNDTKRYWYFRANNIEEQLEWIMIFTYACRKSNPQYDSDVIIREAFMNSFQQTRQLYGFYGSFNMKIGNEIELLENFVRSILLREILNDVISSIENDTLEEMIKNAPIESIDRRRSASVSNLTNINFNLYNPLSIINSMITTNKRKETILSKQKLIMTIHRVVNNKINPAVTNCWLKSRDKVINSSTHFINRVIPLSSQILQCEEAIEELLYAPVVARIDPANNDLQYRLLTPLSLICGPCILDAYEFALRSLFNEISKRIGIIICNPSTLNDEINNLIERVDYNHIIGNVTTDNINSNNLLITSKEILLNMANIGLNNLEDDFIGTITPIEIYYRTMDDLRSLLQDTIYSFGYILKEQGVTNRIIVLFNEIILKLCTDMSTKMRVSFFSILQEVSECSVQDSMIHPCKDLFKEVKKLAFIPPQLKDIIHTHFVGDRFIKELVCMNLTNNVEGMFSESAERLQRVVTQLCETLPIKA